jgi:hypothetical protein
MKMQQKDALVFRIADGVHTIQQVTKDSCTPIKSSEILHPGQNYMHVFNEAGVVFFATEQGCQNGFRMVVEVEPTPINKYAQAFIKAEKQFLKKQEPKPNSATGVTSTLFLLLLLL